MGGNLKRKRRKTRYGHTLLELKILMTVNNAPVCENWEWVCRPSKLIISLLIPYFESFSKWLDERRSLSFLLDFLGVDLYHINIKGYLCWSLSWAKCCYFSLLHCWSFFFSGSHKTKWVINVGKKKIVIFLHGFLILFLVVFFYNVVRTIHFLLRKIHTYTELWI